MNNQEYKDRYNRHILLKEIGEEGQQLIKESRVLLVGVGGLGSPIALYLAAAGVGTLGLIDGDVVSETNLQRQVLYAENEVGLPKVECAARRLKALNSETQIVTYYEKLVFDTISHIVAGYDLVVDGCDNYATRYLINDECVKQGKPYVYGAIGEFHGQVSVFNYQGGKNYRDLYPDEELLASMPRPTLGVMGVVPGIIGTIEAAETLKIIARCGEVLRNRLLSMNVLTMETVCINLD